VEASPRQPPAPRRTQHERTAESGRRLLAAAMELIAERGYEATTAAQIGLRAGYSRAMVHARFGSKEDLLDHLLRSEYEDLIAPPPAPGASGLEQALAILDGFTALAVQDPGFLKTVFVLNFEAAGNAQTLRPRISAWIARLEARLVDGLTAGAHDGSVRPGVDPGLAARDILQAGIGAAYTWIVVPGADVLADVARIRARTIADYGAPTRATTARVT
jgi:AcrR family transcriptional regulator